jgi:8-oxo-dGTP pyrophosphatase MutT (NUDIX family)
MSSRFEPTGGETRYEGKILTVRSETFRHEDGEEVTREIVRHQGAVGVVAHDGERIYLVRQPREAVGSPDLLELPAGKLDVEGETPLECAQRELAEEIGKSAGDWRELKSFYTSPGFTNERVWLFLATELYDSPQGRSTDDRIEIVEFPLTELDTAIDRCEDAESLIGLWMLKELI